MIDFQHNFSKEGLPSFDESLSLAEVKNSQEIVDTLKVFSFVIRKVLSKKITMKYLPKLLFVKDESFDYAEKIENLIKQTNK